MPRVKGNRSFRRRKRKIQNVLNREEGPLFQPLVSQVKENEVPVPVLDNWFTNSCNQDHNDNSSKEIIGSQESDSPPSPFTAMPTGTNTNNTENAIQMKNSFAIDKTSAPSEYPDDLDAGVYATVSATSSIETEGGGCPSIISPSRMSPSPASDEDRPYSSKIGINIDTSQQIQIKDSIDIENEDSSQEKDLQATSDRQYEDRPSVPKTGIAEQIQIKNDMESETKNANEYLQSTSERQYLETKTKTKTKTRETKSIADLAENLSICSTLTKQQEFNENPNFLFVSLQDVFECRTHSGEGPLPEAFVAFIASQLLQLSLQHHGWILSGDYLKSIYVVKVDVDKRTHETNQKTSYLGSKSDWFLKYNNDAVFESYTQENYFPCLADTIINIVAMLLMGIGCQQGKGKIQHNFPLKEMICSNQYLQCRTWMKFFSAIGDGCLDSAIKILDDHFTDESGRGSGSQYLNGLYNFDVPSHHFQRFKASPKVKREYSLYSVEESSSILGDRRSGSDEEHVSVISLNATCNGSISCKSDMKKKEATTVSRGNSLKYGGIEIIIDDSDSDSD